VERPESSNTIRRIIMMNIQQPTSLLTFKFSRKHFDLIVGVMITRIFPESIAILEVLARKFDEKKEMTFSAILLELFDILGKSSVRYFKEKCNLLKDKLKLTKNQEDFIMKSVALEIADGIFSRYPAIDVVKVWHYLIWRYYIVFEK
jgi:dynactin complex subunit